MTEERNQDVHNKVTPIEPYLKAREEEEDGISQLLGHMRQMREAVPVNRRLQVELRKKLLERQQELLQTNAVQTPKPEIPLTPPRAPQPVWLKPLLAMVATLVVVIGLTGLWRSANGRVLLDAASSPQELTRFWTESTPLQPAISPDGSQLLVVRGGGLVLLSDKGSQLATLEAPQGITFRSPSWSPNGKEISYVQASEEGEAIQQISAEELLASRKSRTLAAAKTEASSAENRSAADAKALAEPDTALLAKAQATTVHYANLNYAPDGQSLAFVVNTVGETPQVWVRDAQQQERPITEGDAPTWSPDGKALVVQRPSRQGGYELWLVKVENGEAQLLGPGEKPAWAETGYLAFCTDKTEERILTFLPSGQPQYTVRQQVPEIRTVYLGKDGSPALEQIKNGEEWLAISHLLVAPENRISGLELNWLRQQEISQSYEPKTLVLNEVRKCEGQVFGPDGNWLFYTRRDGDTVALLKLRVTERWEKERD